ncbi:MAG: hypothetical protein PHC88_11900 [Terrimicrobiaceae bacterium]|nr:hypothetical protein [Terrimicrobiaceae bacterium]
MAKRLAAETVETLKHDRAKRKDIPAAGHQSVLDETRKHPMEIR